MAPDTATAATEQAAEAETAEEAIDVVTEPTAVASKVDQAAVDPAADVSTAGDLAPASPVDPPAASEEKPPEAASDPAAHEAEEALALAEGAGRSERTFHGNELRCSGTLEQPRGAGGRFGSPHGEGGAILNYARWKLLRDFK